MFKLSIIIPVRNGEQTIRNTLQSIVEQHFSEQYEVIIADDGSEDNTIKIVQEFAATLPLSVVRTTSLEHTPGNAMNEGLKHAQGEWITLIDADDLFPENALNSAFQHIFEDNLQYYCCLSIQAEENGDIWDLWASDSWVHGKFYNREFLSHYNIIFNGKSFCEDTDFNMQALTTLFSLGEIDDLCFQYYPEHGYIWHQNPDSITHQIKYINDVPYTYADLYFSDYMEAHFSRLVNLCLLINKKERCEIITSYLLSTFLAGYFQYQAMSYRTFGHPLEINREILYNAKTILNQLGFSDEDIISFVLTNPDLYYDLKRQSYPRGEFVEMESFYSFINNFSSN